LIFTIIITLVLFKLAKNLISQKVAPLTMTDIKDMNIDVKTAGKVSLYKSVNDGYLSGISRQIKGIMKVLSICSAGFYAIMGTYNYSYNKFYWCDNGIYQNKPTTASFLLSLTKCLIVLMYSVVVNYFFYIVNRTSPKVKQNFDMLICLSDGDTNYNRNQGNFNNLDRDESGDAKSNSYVYHTKM